MTRFQKTLVGVAGTSLSLIATGPAWAASWQSKVSYGANTTMDLYVPDKPASPAPIVVALHYCSGNSGSGHSWFQSAADKYGFIVIAPGAGGNCFDAKPERSGERENITKMVAYVVKEKGGDAKRVFAAGASSGACMTQALLAAYPEVFSAGSSLAGVPAGAWTGGNAYGWSVAGTSGGMAWGDKVRNASKDFTGMRPRVQLWQGMGDTTLTYSQAYPPQVAQWTNVLGVTDANATMESIKPAGANDTWARTSYKKDGLVVVEANSGPQAVPHDLTGRGLFNDVVRFFGLDQPASGGTGGTSGGGGSSGGGGASASGGSTGTGGTTTGTGGATGGMKATGGTTSSTGGSGTSTGGTTTPTGGSGTSTGGTTTPTGGSGTSTGGDGAYVTNGGCSTSELENGTNGATIGTLLVAALGLVLRGRRRSRS